MEHQLGVITAKATFQYDEHGAVELDTQDPLPLFDGDQETELGLLPRDDLPRRDPVFEVILLGAAHAPGGRPVRQLTVGLSVGGVRRELLVYGDRHWIDRERISAPEPFTRMPLTFDRAYGGSAEILVDRDAYVQVADPINRHGRGFDPQPAAEGIARMLRAPAGYPVSPPVRPLPNLEDPRSPIARWEDAPAPSCWATVPMDTGFHFLRSVEHPSGAFDMNDAAQWLSRTDWLKDSAFHRAHPDWVIEPPAASSEVLLEHLHPTGPVRFTLPELAVYADFVLGERLSTWPLMPQALILLPEQGRFCLIYRHRFTAAPTSEEERGCRLRIERGWHTHPNSDEEGER